jgi:hypothetical protein
MNCSKCGGPNERSAKYCIHCGTPLRKKEPITQGESPHYYDKEKMHAPPFQPKVEEMSISEETVEDKGGCWIAVVSFLFPIVGLILWIIWSTQRPRSAEVARNGFIASVIALLLLFILLGVSIFLFAADLFCMTM